PQQLLKLRDDQRTAAEVRMNRDVDESTRLVIVQIIKRVDVDIQIIARARAQDSVIDKVGPRQGYDRAIGSLLLARQADVECVRIPFDAGLGEQVEGVLVPSVDWRRPPFRTCTRSSLEEIQDPSNRRSLLLRRHLQEVLILGIAVPFDEM